MKRARSRYALWPPALALLLVVAGCSRHDESDKRAGSDDMTPSNGAGARAGATGTAGSSASGTATGRGMITSPAAVPKELTISGPIPAGMKKPFTTTSADLPAFGYSEKEFFIEGGATAYTLPGGMTMDGKWTLMEASKAAFKTRLIVRRPIDASKFNGTVIVEWLNVSGGADGDPGFMYNSDLILREGYAYVGVSAQAQGVIGGGFSLGAGPAAVPLVMYDPERYGTLKHPGDAYSFDIFSQAAEAIRSPGKADVLEGLEPQRLIAYGESQSAMRMVSYVNGVHPLAHRYDGFFIHSRGAGGVPFEEAAGGLGGISLGGGGAALIRDDIDEKVFQFQTETDVTGMLAFLPARQPDSEKLRTWEVAGTAHADQFILDFNAAMTTEGAIQCAGANTGPQYRVIRAALHSLNSWMKDGTEPTRGAVLSTDANGKSMRDERGNAIGGVRSPDVDVPVKTLSGDPAATGGGNLLCFLFGSTTPFTADQLMQLYPTHDDYVAKVKESASKLRQAGFLLEPEESGFVADAQKAPVPN